MKYYAVTDDIHELYHYGVKGMKWGQHLFGEDKSPGYKRAASKLRGLAKKSRNDVETRSDRRYRKQLEKAFKRSQTSQQKYGWDQVADGIKANERAFKETQKAVNNARKANVNQNRYEMRMFKTQAKQAKLAAKAEKKFDRYLQDAREGKLRAGKLSDDQLQRISDRLLAERQARQFGNTEKGSYRERRKEAIREGKLEGYRRGTAAGMEALAKGLVEMGIKSRVTKAINNRAEAKRQRTRNRILNKKTHRDLKRELREESYKEKIRDDTWRDSTLSRLLSPTKRAAIRLNDINKEKEQKKVNEEIQLNQYKDWLKRGKNEKADDYRARIEEEANNGTMRNELRAHQYYTIAPRRYGIQRTNDWAKKHLSNLASEIGNADYEGSSSPIKKNRRQQRDYRRLTDKNIYAIIEGNQSNLSSLSDIEPSAKRKDSNSKRRTKQYSQVTGIANDSGNNYKDLIDQLAKQPENKKHKRGKKS